MPAVIRNDMPQCPHCYHMLEDRDTSANLDQVATCELKILLACPKCEKSFWCAGTYLPQYDTSADEDDL